MHVNSSVLEVALQFNITQFMSTIKQQLHTLNLFATVPPAIDESEIRNQRRSTRLFIILLFYSIVVVGEYISLVSVSRTIVVPTPTLQQYSSLYLTYSQSLTCPCSQISSSYNVFLPLRFTFHQICTSIFVSVQWYNYLFEYNRANDLFQDDFRKFSPYIFQTLETFCEISNKTISASLDIFFSTQYVTATVTPLRLFQSQAQATFVEFVSSTRANLLSSLQVILDINQVNGIMTLSETLYTLLKNEHNSLNMRYYVVSNCSCLFSAKCIVTTNIYEYSDQTILFTIPEVYIGCTTAEGLLQSSLICFYNQTCVDRILSYMQLRNSSIHIPALTTSNSDRYPINSTVQELVGQLMVEAWDFSPEYDTYFNACRPVQCTYTYMARNDVLFIITSLFGLIGGLVKVLKLIVPLAVKYIPQIIKCIRRPSHQQMRLENGKVHLNDCYFPLVQKCHCEDHISDTLYTRGVFSA